MTKLQIFVHRETRWSRVFWMYDLVVGFSDKDTAVKNNSRTFDILKEIFQRRRKIGAGSF